MSPAWAVGRSALMPAAFRRQIRRECARTDRTGQVFSLIAFAARRHRKRLIRTVTARVRETDEIGWLESGRLAVLLPDTPGPGAHALAEEIRGRIAASEILCTVHTYPRDWVEEDLSAEPPDPVRFPAWKRGMDMAGALLALLLLAPLLLAIAVAVRLSSPGPVLFRQERIGYRGRPFLIYKFRTMTAGASETPHVQYLRGLIDGTVQPSDGSFKIRRDQRVTPVGRILRRWSLDELPQLINVLKGDMSLVGPRPEPGYARVAYSRWYHRRTLEAKPGITGLWQVEGRGRVPYQTMIRMDLRYSRSMSPLYDLRLLVRTIGAVVSGGGAH